MCLCVCVWGGGGGVEIGSHRDFQSQPYIININISLAQPGLSVRGQPKCTKVM